MDQLMDYITSFDPKFPSRIEGASKSDIERLERVANEPLPPDYRIFLELMGRRDDEFILDADDILTSAATLADFYEESIESGEKSIPPGCIAFAISGISIGVLALETAPPNRVFQIICGQRTNLWAESFRGFLYQQAFRRSTKYNIHSFRLMSRDKSPRHDRAEDLIGTMGFERLWFSDSVTLCHESAGDKIMFRQIPGRRASVWLASRRITRLWRLAFRAWRTLDLPIVPLPAPRRR